MNSIFEDVSAKGGDSSVPASTLVEVLQRAHNDNEKLQYYATRDRKMGRGHSIMPVTPFVFEIFIYNSIYQVDWAASLNSGSVKNHLRNNVSESWQQAKLEQFLKPHVRTRPALLYNAFTQIRDADLEGDWTAVVPDARISSADGDQFFNRLRFVRQALRDADAPEGFCPNGEFFKRLGDCRYFIYSVRNNIFHGSKTIGETYEQNQRTRLDLYLTFTRCLNRLCFSVWDETNNSDSMRVSPRVARGEPDAHRH